MICHRQCALFDMSLYMNYPSSSLVLALSLHDALPIFHSASCMPCGATSRVNSSRARRLRARAGCRPCGRSSFLPRSEEHTSELQSQSNLVCRLLLEKKNNRQFDSIMDVAADYAQQFYC